MNRRLARDVGQPLEHVVDGESRAYEDDRDRAELAERHAGEVDDCADGEAGPGSQRHLSVDVWRQQTGVRLCVGPHGAETDRDHECVQGVKEGDGVGIAGYQDIGTELGGGEG